MTHNIIVLLAVLEEQGCDVADLWGLVKYNAFAVQFRYEQSDDLYESLDRPATIREVAGLLERVEAIVKT